MQLPLCKSVSEEKKDAMTELIMVTLQHLKLTEQRGHQRPAMVTVRPLFSKDKQIMKAGTNDAKFVLSLRAS